MKEDHADKIPALDTVRFISVADMMNLVRDVGFDRFVTERPHFLESDLLADPDDPRDLFGMLLRAAMD